MTGEPQVLASGTTVPAYRPLLPCAADLLPYLQRIDATRIYSNQGPLVSELESRLETTLQQPAGSIRLASSGTAALVGGILATAGPATPERPLAICPAYTFIGTVAALRQCGYEPWLMDVDTDSWQLDAQALIGHPLLERTGIIVPVAPFGRAIEMAPWQHLRELSGVDVVIDGAACIEAIRDEPARYSGMIPVALSFHATKVFATGEGGALLTSDPAMTRRVFQSLNFGFLGSRDSRTPSINGKLSEYHAAIGLASLDHWGAMLGGLQRVGRDYRAAFAAIGLEAQLHTAPEIASNYVLLDCGDAASAARLILSLRGHGIESRFWYGNGLHHQTILKQLAHGPLENTDALAPRLLGLPVAPDLNPRLVRLIAELAEQTLQLTT